MTLTLSDYPDAGDFRGWRLAFDVLTAAGKHEREVPRQIDMSRSTHLKPYSLACLAALGAIGGHAIELIVPEDEGCRTHISRVGLPEFFRCQMSASVPRTTSVRIVHLPHGSRPNEEFADDLAGFFEHHMAQASTALPANGRAILAENISELIHNALTHAHSPIGCVIAGQAFPRTGKVEVAVLDLGQTIRGHLTQNPMYRAISSDSEAIIRATEEGVTGTVSRNIWNEPNSGVGLHVLRELCVQGGGELSILSGHSCVIFCKGIDPTSHDLQGGFEGCLVNVKFFSDDS